MYIWNEGVGVSWLHWSIQIYLFFDGAYMVGGEHKVECLDVDDLNDT